MNLAELANALQRYEFDMLNDQVASRLRELHEQTRWIPVSERVPTEADGDRWGEVLILYCGSAVHCEKVENVNGVQYTSSDITHWQRITTLTP
jgi:hypothetical protein